MQHTINDDQKRLIHEYELDQPYIDELTSATGTAIKYAEVEIASADILTMYASPVELVPAPGAGYALELLSAVCILDHGGTNYATQGDLTISTGTTGTALSDTIAGADCLLSAADAIRVVQALSADADLNENESLVIGVGTANPTAGDGVLRVKVSYRVHATGL